MRHLRRAAIVTALALALFAIAGCGTTPSTPSGSGSSGGSGSPATSGSSGATAVTVSMKDFAFNPSTVEVAVGGTVTFTNDDSTPHDVAGDGWSSGSMAGGATYSQTFTTAGTFPIRCTIHPSMTGTVVVK